MALQAINYNYSNVLNIGGTLSITVGANNYEATKGPLKVQSVTQPIGGTVVITGTTALTITQTALNEDNTKSFSYVISYSDNSEPSTGTVTYRTEIVTDEFSINNKTQLVFYPIVGTPFSTTINASNGTPPYTWTFSGLPNGLTNTSNTISGTPTLAGSFPAGVSVSDAVGATDSAQAYFYVTDPASQPVLQGAPFPDVIGAVGSTYSRIYTASGGTAPYTWSLSGFPTGLVVSGSQISGSYTTVGIYTALVLVTDSLGKADSEYITFRITAAGGSFVVNNDTATTNYQTAVTIDVLANDTGSVSIIGLTQPTHGTASVVDGRIVYTPNAEFSGIDTFTYTGSDGATTDQGTVTVTVSAPGLIDAPTITNAPAADVSILPGASYSLDLEATGGVSPYVWTLVNLSGDPWLSIVSSTGVLSGTFNQPSSVAGNRYGVEVTVTDTAIAPKSSKKTIYFVHAQSAYTATIQGTLRLDTSMGPFAARKVYLYSYTTGAKIAETTSNGTTGAWSFTAVAPGDYFVVGAATPDDYTTYERDFDAMGVITVV